MPEAITKYAVNSTLGTPKFQPLDKMITGQKMFVASDTPLISISEASHSDAELKTFATFTPKINGTAKCYCYLGYTSTGGSGYYEFGIYEDGILINGREASSGSDFSGEFVCMLNIKAGKTYEFKIGETKSHHSAKISDFFLGADIVDYNWFEYGIFDV